MSQTSWSRKSQPVEFNNGQYQSGQDSSSGSGDAAAPIYDNNPAIPPNRGGKRYNMHEVFDVWFENKDQILGPNFKLPVQNNENYKSSKTGQIYHLDLQPSTSTGTTRDYLEKELTESMEKLSTNGDADLATQQKTSQGPPPGMAHSDQDPQQNLGQFPGHSQVSVLTPDRIEWFYVDPSGNEQGPFNGDMMQEWLTDGYLHLDLKIRRKEEQNFQALRELCDKVQNYIQPFKIPLPQLTKNSTNLNNDDLSFANPGIQSSHSQIHQFLSGGPGNLGATRLNTSINSQGNIFGGDFMHHHNDPFASPLTPSSAGAFSNSNQFGIDSINPSIGFNHGPPLGNSLQHINNMPSLLQQQFQQQQNPPLPGGSGGWGIDHQNSLIGSGPSTPVSVAPVLPSQMNQPMSPWLSGVQSSSRVNSPFIPTSTLSNNDKQGSNNHTSTQRQDSSNDPVLDDIHSSVVTGILSDGEEGFTNPNVEKQKLKQKQKQQKQQKPEQHPVKANSSTKDQVKPQSQPDRQPTQPKITEKIATTSDISSTSEDTKKSASSQPKLAPWASVKTNTLDQKTKPALTLKEIQMDEAEKLKEQKQIESAIRLEQSMRERKDEQHTEERPVLPSTSSWGMNATNKPGVAKKTLAEIQREEVEAARSKAKAVGTSPAATITSKSSFANALANSVPKDNSPWTVVTPKKPIVKKPSQASIITTSTTASKANPQLLRSVSANMPVKSNVNTLALKEEFLVWARASMTNLYPTVSKDDLLDIFTTLPVNGDSSQIIAETIYSSSATMDGRRFTDEFLKRRQRVEQQAGPHESVSWGSAIISSADKVSTVDEEGWSTNVKSKKKGKKV